MDVRKMKEEGVTKDEGRVTCYELRVTSYKGLEILRNS